MVDILIRTAVAFVLVALTFNPTQWNYVRWAEANWAEQMPLAILFGLILLVGFIIYLRATLRSIGAIGMGLVAAVIAALVWVFNDLGWLSLDNATLNTWIGIIAISLVLGIGLSWSIIRRRISGQVDMDDIEE